MQPYYKHTSWVKSPWNYANFLLEFPLNSLDLDVGKIIEPCNSFLAKVRKLESQKARESQRTLLKKLGGNPIEVSQFGRIHSRKSLFAKSKFWGFRKVYLSKPPSVWSFSGITHTPERRQGVPCMSSTRLSRSGLPSLI